MHRLHGKVDEVIASAPMSRSKNGRTTPIPPVNPPGRSTPMPGEATPRSSRSGGGHRSRDRDRGGGHSSDTGSSVNGDGTYSHAHSGVLTGLWCDNCSKRLVEFKRQAIKIWMPYAANRNTANIKVRTFVSITIFPLLISRALNKNFNSCCDPVTFSLHFSNNIFIKNGVLIMEMWLCT